MSLKLNCFNSGLKKIHLQNNSLRLAIEELTLGQYEANLGSYLIKKRIAIAGKGKRGGLQTIIAFKKDDKAFFVYGYPKNVKDNISPKEQMIYKELAKILIAYSNSQLKHAIKHKKIFEVL